MVRRLALCYLLAACHGKTAIVAGSITGGVGIIAASQNPSNSASTDGASVLIITGIIIAIYGVATLHHGEQKMTIMPTPYPYPNQPGPYPYPNQPPPYPVQPAPDPNQPPPPPEPPLPASELVISDPRVKQLAVNASAAARHNDCASAKASANQLPPDLLAQLRRIDGALVACLDH